MSTIWWKVFGEDMEKEHISHEDTKTRRNSHRKETQRGEAHRTHGKTQKIKGQEAQGYLTALLITTPVSLRRFSDLTR